MSNKNLKPAAILMAITASVIAGYYAVLTREILRDETKQRRPKETERKSSEEEEDEASL